MPFSSGGRAEGKSIGKLRASIDIPSNYAGAKAARHVVAAILPAWGLADLSADAELLVSELVTNAVVHAPGSDSVELELVRRAAGIRIALADGSSIRPIIRELSSARENGRGMLLVVAIANAWGAEDYHGGKRVWVELDQAES